jgi:RHS repeat-associated protein
MDLGGDTYYYHQNAVWSVEAITDSTANAVERYSYDVYGFVTVTDGTGKPVSQNIWGTPHSAIGNPWMFTGQRTDEETGLYFYRFRYYDPSKGRYLQRDPLEYGDGMNLYQYTKDSPVNYADWDGRQAFNVANGSTRCALGEPPTAGIGQGAFVVEINNTACDRECTVAHEAAHVASELGCCSKAREKYAAAGTPKEKNDVIKKWNKEYGEPGFNWSECNARTCGARCFEKLVKDRDCATCFNRLQNALGGAGEEKARSDFDCCEYLLGGVIRKKGGRIKENDERMRDVCSRGDAEPACPFAEKLAPAAPDARGAIKGGLGCFAGTAKGPGEGADKPGEAK